ncbi:hypothetical protein CORT_0B04900 [Candida orthopsilosis Co 90-125]|uniref:Uncharacterized protein n=1 Tax=Candida orthopsilosis (strain 90-125) TaxID=1136231 RepID=H8X1F8_CANO9|nr:hypothetical protein CORT_0B04900 [Candida orthopsilosis Co 90-125]CCG22198.1 hypothetical protein CORT_0B04900 [Candida orthopsilosis Co 90-125]
MKLTSLIPITLLFSSQIVHSFDFSQYDDILDEISSLGDYPDASTDDSIEKRDDGNLTYNQAAVDQYTHLFQTIEQSGLIPNLLEEISNNQTQIDNLVSYLELLLSGDMSSENSTISLNGISINLNMTQIMNAVQESGIIPSTYDQLLGNKENNKKLADFAGGALSSPNNVWIGWLLTDLGQGQALTVPFLADLIMNTTSKANTNDTNRSDINVKETPPLAEDVGLDPQGVNNDGTTRDAVYINLDGQEASRVKRMEEYLLSKRASDVDDKYSGSLSQFLNNAINTVVNSQLVSSSINDIIVALNQSGIITPIVLQVIENDNLSKLINPIVKTLYENGAFNNLPLNYYFIYAKERNILSDGLQFVLTDPHYAPPIARLLKRMEDIGTFQYLQDNMYGPHKRS